MTYSTKVSSNRHEVARAVAELAIPELQFHILPDSEAGPVLEEIAAHFVERTGLRWWWEAFRDTKRSHVHFPDGAGWRHIRQVVPPETGLLWFIVEDKSEFVLCEATIDAVQAVIGECWAFEYYVVSQKLDWLVGENHHDVVFAVGSAVSDRLTQEASS